MFDKHEADVIVIETNQGGELLSNLLNSVRQGLPIQTQHAKRGKMLRAEGPAALYEQGKVAHVSPPELREEPLAALEEEMCSWTPGSSDSPDRLDALVYALLELSAPLPGAGLLEFYKLEAAKVLAAKGCASGRQSLVAPTWRKRQVDPEE